MNLHHFSFYNNLTHHLPRLTEFFFGATLLTTLQADREQKSMSFFYLWPIRCLVPGYTLHQDCSQASPKQLQLLSSVADPNPEDPGLFGNPDPEKKNGFGPSSINLVLTLKEFVLFF